MPGFTIMAHNDLRVAVLSGKGGTGKTFVAVNLAAALKEATYIDCDIEAPNGHLFFKPVVSETIDVTLMKPYVDDKKCTGCKVCVDGCAFNALAYVHHRVMVFEDICHSCGACVARCPEKALLEKAVSIGEIGIGQSLSTQVYTGSLEIGKASGVPIIAKLMRLTAQMTGPLIVDGPPGSACTVMEVVKNADFCLLVAEPTAFGLHNLKMVLELVGLFKKPFGVILNKQMAGNNLSEDYCIANDVPIYGRIPYDAAIGSANNEGRIYVLEDDQYKTWFKALYNTIVQEVQSEATARS